MNKTKKDNHHGYIHVLVKTCYRAHEFKICYLEKCTSRIKRQPKNDSQTTKKNTHHGYIHVLVGQEGGEEHGAKENRDGEPSHGRREVERLVLHPPHPTRKFHQKHRHQALSRLMFDI